MPRELKAQEIADALENVFYGRSGHLARKELEDILSEDEEESTKISITSLGGDKVKLIYGDDEYEIKLIMKKI